MNISALNVSPKTLKSFLTGGEWEGVNVTIPYKRSVIPYLAGMSDIARRLGNVNTITRRKMARSMATTPITTDSSAS